MLSTDFFNSAIYVVENMRRANEGDGRDKARVQFYGALPELPRLAVAFLRLQIPKLSRGGRGEGRREVLKD